MVSAPGRNLSGDAAQYEALSPALWNPVGNAVVAAARLQAGERVLDAFCRTGASAVPAAQTVGKEGIVDAVEPSSGMLEIAGHKAGALDLEQLKLHHADPVTWTGGGDYDVVVASYDLFTLAEMDDAAGHLGGLLRPGGRFAVSAWASDAHRDFADTLFAVCARHNPESEQCASVVAANTHRVDTSDSLKAWLTGLGLTNVEIAPVHVTVPLDADLAWSLVEGSWYERLLPRNAEARRNIQDEFLSELGAEHALNADTLIAVAEPTN